MNQEINLLSSEIEDETTTSTSTPLDEKTNLRGSHLETILTKVRKQEEREQKKRSQKNLIKRIIESLLFASSSPITFYKIRQIICESHSCPQSMTLTALQELKLEYETEDRSFELAETEEGFLLRSKSEFSPYVHKLFTTKRGEKLSSAATEVLAIIAYKQPITRAQVDAIRGVDSTGTMLNLLERELVENCGRLEAPGRPNLYQITQKFYTFYGIKAKEELPQIRKQTQETT